ncbi:MAG: hypothetical protein KG075_09505 [Alphaproteobacteria bacterium]|nr:hypothetical protein [Alphaproteobacteria bacterium]
MSISDLVQRTRQFVSGRAGAYRRVFNLESLDVETVLVDLARFCRAHESTGSQDPAIAARLDGRREVWLRIQQNLKLTDQQLWLLYGANSPNVKG